MLIVSLCERISEGVISSKKIIVLLVLSAVLISPIAIGNATSATWTLLHYTSSNWLDINSVTSTTINWFFLNCYETPAGTNTVTVTISWGDGSQWTGSGVNQKGYILNNPDGVPPHTYTTNPATYQGTIQCYGGSSATFSFSVTVYSGPNDGALGGRRSVAM